MKIAYTFIYTLFSLVQRRLIWTTKEIKGLKMQFLIEKKHWKALYNWQFSIKKKQKTFYWLRHINYHMCHLIYDITLYICYLEGTWLRFFLFRFSCLQWFNKAFKIVDQNFSFYCPIISETQSLQFCYVNKAYFMFLFKFWIK